MNCQAEAIACSKTCDLWKEVKNIRGHSKVSPPNVDVKVKAAEISKLFSEKYNLIYNKLPSDLSAVRERVNASVHMDLVKDFTVNT